MLYVIVCVIIVALIIIATSVSHCVKQQKLQKATEDKKKESLEFTNFQSKKDGAVSSI